MIVNTETTCEADEANLSTSSRRLLVELDILQTLVVHILKIV